MHTREKFLVITAAVVALWGVLYLPTNESKAKGTKRSAAQDESLFTEFDQKIAELKALELKSEELNLLVYATRDVELDPLLDGLSPLEKEKLSKQKQGATPQVGPADATTTGPYFNTEDFLYTGYFEVEGLKVAIVNDTDLVLGDTLPNSDLTVHQIQPGSIEVINGDEQKFLIQFSNRKEEVNP